MALVNSSFTVNVAPDAMPPIVHVSEYDIGRTFTVTINGQNGSAFNIPSGTTATVEGTLNGVIGFTTDATISGSTVSFALTESMTAVSGKAWCKIKLTLNDEPIQTCAFVLAVDRAGVEADTVIGASGFEQQIVGAVNDWLDEHPPAVGGMSEAFKQALLDCFEHVAWINDQGQDYYDALYDALYPPVDVLSISAVFTQGEAVIYDTDSLDDLKQYLVVTATMTDSTTQTVTNYTLSGTLTVGTSTITVLYNGKTDTFDVTVIEGQGLPAEYQQVEYIEGTGTQYIDTGITPTDTFGFKIAFSSRDVRTDTSYFGTKVGTNMACYGGFYNGKPFLGWNSAVTDNGLIASVTAGSPTEVSLNYKNSREVKQGNTSILQANKSPLATLTGDYSSVPFRLCGRNNSETPSVRAAMFFSVEFTNGSDVVANMIPCYHKTSGVIGMYDIVRKRFFTNDGTGTFLKGGDVA